MNNWLSRFGRTLVLSLAILTITFPAGAQAPVETQTPAEAPEEGDHTAATREKPEELEPLVEVPEVEDAPAPEQSKDIEEMVVLASGRDDFLKSMSVSVTSFSAAEIKTLRIQNIADLADFTPNLEINTRSAASNPTLFIRGIGLKDYNANAAGAVAVYQDGININAPAIQLGQLFDVSSIDVLRGPQGSVNGRNATAGAIMINSTLPDGETETSASFTYGNFNNINVEGAISLPIIEDLLSVRVAATANFREGLTTNHCANWDPESLGRPLLTETKIREYWANNLYPTHRNDQPSGTYFFTENDGTPNFHDHVKNHGTGIHEHLKGNPIPKFPLKANARFAEGPGTTDPARQISPDGVCVVALPGQLFFPLEPGNADPFWNSFTEDNPNILLPEDFQGLKKKVNNVDNWAARMILRFQPDVGEGMDWVLNIHGGQNLGDSKRLQALAAQFLLNQGDPFYKENLGFVTDVTSGANSTVFGTLPPLEGTRLVRGLEAFDSNDGDRKQGGRGGSDIDAGFYNQDGLELLDAYGTSLRGVWDTGFVKLTSISGFEWYERSIEDEGDYTAESSAAAILFDSAWQFSEELRIEGSGEDYEWATGGFTLYESLDASNIFPGLLSRRLEQFFEQTLTSGAVYGNAKYWLLDEVSVSVGIRYNHEHKKFTLNSNIEILGGNSVNSIPEASEQKVWTGVTGEVQLAWQPGGDWMYDARLDSLNMYIKFGRGMKGGHFNAGLTIQSNASQVQRIDPVEPEFINSVEFGFKSSWLQDRLHLNFAAFRYWYQNLQVFDYTNEFGELPIQRLLNSDARVIGAELEGTIYPLPGFKVQFGVSWLDAEFVDFFVTKAIGQPRGVGAVSPFDYSGNPLISAPDFSFNALVNYEISLSRWGTLVPQYTTSFRTRVYLDPQAVKIISQSAFWVHNARITYRTPDGRFEIAGWVDNFLEKRYRIDAFDVAIGQNQILEVWNDPRMFGLTASAYF
ncbi:MAG: TonB-dependent receptor plug domain-containing protein [Myxococcales bacterium]|nr:TonB-dependent receptor plug domain-containing protein [Myxococcales bacterium]